MLNMPISPGRRMSLLAALLGILVFAAASLQPPASHHLGPLQDQRAGSTCRGKPDKLSEPVGIEADESISAQTSPALDQLRHHLDQLNVNSWHVHGYNGRGVKVAILDSGFRRYQDFLGKALPAHVQGQSFRMDHELEAKDSQHGILCGEVVHSLAPEADLIFANWDPDQPKSFLDAVRWARDQGAEIISCSVITPSWSDGEGGGPVHEALAHILGTGKDGCDVLCFASAGNMAQRHWSGLFRDAGDGFHEWVPGHEDNELSPWGNEEVSVELCSKAGTSYDLHVYDRTAEIEVGRSAGAPLGDICCSVCRFQPVPDHSYQVRVRLTHGEPGHFHLVALGSSLCYATASGSIAFPADGPAVVAVGAVDDFGHRVPYSSCGPNSTAPKPDLVAPVPFPTMARSRPFSGTSAAAPQAAGLAALLWSRHPDWTAGRVRRALCESAQELGPAGHDSETGYGSIRLP